jgi:phospholipase C
MSANVKKIKTIFIVMLENRSFDHMLGYLGLPEFRGSKVDGFRDPASGKDRIRSSYNGNIFPPWYSNDPFSPLAADPPHERDDIALQLDPRTSGKNTLDGFVTNYAKVASVQKNDQPPVMSYFGMKEVPITHFLAENFAICDRWFSSLPAGTQPNRLMAMSGETLIDKNTHILPAQNLVYDWLDEHAISWRVYHEGMPFFVMMPHWTPRILDNTHFRGFAELQPDILKARPGENEMHSVVFLEPGYTDAPHTGRSSDDHAPSGASAGQEFLMKAYNALTLDPDLWSGSVMVVTYDEHGGFFDHVPPVELTTNPPEGATYPAFATSGVRVPAFIVSPFVESGQVYRKTLDHTSILKFLGTCFDPKGSYSAVVDQRPVQSVLDVLNLDLPARDIPAAPNLNPYLAQMQGPVGRIPGTVPYNEIARSFQTALDLLHAHSVPAMQSKFAELESFVTRTT